MEEHMGYQGGVWRRMMYGKVYDVWRVREGRGVKRGNIRTAVR